MPANQIETWFPCHQILWKSCTLSPEHCARGFACPRSRTAAGMHQQPEERAAARLRVARPGQGRRMPAPSSASPRTLRRILQDTSTPIVPEATVRLRTGARLGTSETTARLPSRLKTGATRNARENSFFLLEIFPPMAAARRALFASLALLLFGCVYGGDRNAISLRPMRLRGGSSR